MRYVTSRRAPLEIRAPLFVRSRMASVAKRYFHESDGHVRWIWLQLAPGERNRYRRRYH